MEHLRYLRRGQASDVVSSPQSLPNNAPRAMLIVKVNLFCSSTTAIRKGIAAEAQRLSHLFEKEVVLEDESPSSSQL